MHVVFDYSLAPRPYPVSFFVPERRRQGNRSELVCEEVHTDVESHTPGRFQGDRSETSELTPVQVAARRKEGRRSELNVDTSAVVPRRVNVCKPAIAIERSRRTTINAGPDASSHNVVPLGRVAAAPTMSLSGLDRGGYKASSYDARTPVRPFICAQPPLPERAAVPSYHLGDIFVGSVPGIGFGADVGQMYALPVDVPPPRYRDLY